MDRYLTTAEALGRGMTEDSLLSAERSGRLRRVVRGVYIDGSINPTELDRQIALVIRAHAIARGRLAGVLHGLDGIELRGAQKRHALLPDARVLEVDGLRCADGLQTLVDLAAELSDEVWEQALESALRKRLVTVSDLEAALPELGRARARGTARIRRILRLRPPGAPPTESLLETLFVQLARDVDELPDPVRQYQVFDSDGLFVARLDTSWPELGLFIELDGHHHKGQPVYDARRETAVVAATAWLPGRFTWREVRHLRKTTARRLAELADQARRRPLDCPS